MRATGCLTAALLAAGCNLFITPAPPVVRPDTPVTCTDSYWLPAADATATVLLLGYGAWVAHEFNNACDRGDADACDPQGPIAVTLPFFAAGVFAVSAEAGRRRVNRCRRAKAWVRETTMPPMAGRIGAACVPAFGANGRCVEGDCVDGTCLAPRPRPDDVRRMCAEAVGRWRAGLLATLPPACRSRGR